MIPNELKTDEQKIAFAILCAMECAELWDSTEWVEWAKDWLRGIRTERVSMVLRHMDEKCEDGCGGAMDVLYAAIRYGEYSGDLAYYMGPVWQETEIAVEKAAKVIWPLDIDRLAKRVIAGRCNSEGKTRLNI